MTLEFRYEEINPEYRAMIENLGKSAGVEVRKHICVYKCVFHMYVRMNVSVHTL